MRIRKFKLSDNFIEQYKDRQVPWGYNGLGYVVFKRTYSRKLSEFEEGAEGTEEWYQTCRRVIEGMFSIQKNHVQSLGLPWSDAKAQRMAKEAYERLFIMKWTPPGRGLWSMGTEFLETRSGAAAFNCAHISTADIASKGGEIFQWIMDALMLGIGVGFDLQGAGKVVIKQPGTINHPANYHTEHVYNAANTYTMADNYVCKIADNREGWAESIRVLIDCFIFGYSLPTFDYSGIRAKGEPIKGFGGVASGPQPLIDLHNVLVSLYTEAIGKPLPSTLIVDTENVIGRCVISGNVRRSAAIAFGDANDKEFLTMKNDPTLLQDWRWASNNSANSTVGMDYTWHANQTKTNGEPGYGWLDNARHYGRMLDQKKNDDTQIVGPNPCGEIFLESHELCNVAEFYPAKHDSFEDMLQTVKIVYLYCKTVTLLKTHWPETNAVMQKNRRIGLGQAGIVQAIDKFGYRQMMKWNDDIYQYVQDLDRKYSDWLCIPRSKRTTTVKPGGTTPLLNGSTPGLHFPEDEYYIRRIRFADDSELLPPLIAAGYHVEPCIYSPRTMVVSFPIKEEYFNRGKREVSMWEQLNLVADYQGLWADNAVSATVTFKTSEEKDIKYALEKFETKLKGVSFLKYEETGYKQAPYEPITLDLYNQMISTIIPLQAVNLNSAEDALASNSFCDGDACKIDWTSLKRENSADAESV